MKMFILCAGTGSRLLPLTQDTPKSLLDFGNGVTLLEKQLSKVEKTDKITEVTIITGYLSDKIEAFIKEKKFNKPPIKIEFNPFYQLSNNLLSLWTIRHLLLDQDFIISNGDNLYKENVFNKIFAQITEPGIYLTIDHKPSYDMDDMKVRFDDTQNICEVSKKIASKEAAAESVGLALVQGKEHRQAFYEAMIDLCKNPNNLQEFWLTIFNELIKKGTKIKPAIINADDWLELDFHPDIHTIRKALFASLKT